MMIDFYNFRVDIGEIFICKILIVGIFFQYWNEFISYRIYIIIEKIIGLDK